MTNEQSALDGASVFLGKIAQLLMQSERLAGDWDAAALSVILDGRSYDASGFRYNADRKAIPIAPAEEAIYDELIAYRDFQARQSSDPAWKACLIKLDRVADTFEILVEYDNPRRWKITPANLAQMRESMRP